jgi:hypothetical protein
MLGEPFQGRERRKVGRQQAYRGEYFGHFGHKLNDKRTIMTTTSKWFFPPSLIRPPSSPGGRLLRAPFISVNTSHPRRVGLAEGRQKI